MLLELAETEKVRGDNVKAGVYFKAAKAVREYDRPITDGKMAAKMLTGVGKKIGAKIDELLTTGSLARLERERGDMGTNALRQLQRVSGIGVKKAEALQAQGITDLMALTARVEADPSVLNDEQTIGLRHLSDFESRIPRAEMALLEEIVRRAAAAHQPPLQMTVCGSYRRGKPDSGDIDCLLCHPSFSSAPADRDGGASPRWLSTIVEALKATGFVTDVISLGLKKCACVCRLPEAQWQTLAGSNTGTPPEAGGPAASEPTNGKAATDPSVDDADTDCVDESSIVASLAHVGGGGSGGGGSHGEEATPTAPAVALPTFKQLLAKKAALRQGKQASTNLFSAWQAQKAGGTSDAAAPSSSSPAPSSAGAHGSLDVMATMGDAASGGSKHAQRIKEMRAEMLAESSSAAAATVAALPGAAPMDVVGGPSFGLSAFGSSAFGSFDATAKERGPRYRRLDLRLVPYESYFTSILYFTGSDEHNKQMRSAAIAQGLKLSEYGVYRVTKATDGNDVEVALPGLDSEHAVYKALGMAYKAPHERNDRGHRRDGCVALLACMAIGILVGGYDTVCDSTFAGTAYVRGCGSTL